MTPSSVTCPHCQASFRITNVQLKAAKGSVRCGSCLQVFNALEQLERLPAEEPVKVAEPVTDASETEIEELEFDDTPGEQSPSSESSIHDNAVSTSQAKVSSSALPLEYDGYHHETVETLIFENEEHEHDDLLAPEIAERTSSPLLKVAIVILSLALVAQYGWFNRNQLALNTALRPAYSFVCQLAQCELPPLFNIQAIRSLDLVIRTHPENSQALQIDAVIINEAGHTQPFPDIQLTFTDINGRLIASRSFTPPEYLGGELAGSDLMPEGQPIRLGLEIMDPGQSAVNYQLSFAKSALANR